ncbi:hypothetical protein QCN29_24030 [Streptomyces sp. HNM0663]|uniref:Uncharacterized protein n=1 Tax=Streptomyces chengmaiensis TaxID=3040919 RepID=A0ABT6HVB7_9ACTN|nr:hypothetical protein [Streptomyces chengmaiensis]MDH2391789.1 hypothetical protein [Streptomyces chengmaiensis]
MTGEDEEEAPAQHEYFEDIFVEDIGLTWVTSKWDIPDALSPEDAEQHLPEGGPAAWWLTLPASAVEEFDRSKARQFGQDVRRLVESSLPDETIRTAWLGATHGCFDPAEYGFDARTWLRKLEEAWLARVRQDEPAFAPPSPQPVADEDLRHAVLQAIRPVADDLSRTVTAASYGTPAAGLVPALEQVVTQVCADLGYRLFLRAMKAYFVEIDKKSHDAFIALGERFGYPKYLVGDGLNYRE